MLLAHLLDHIVGYVCLLGVLVWSAFVFRRFRRSTEPTCWKRFFSSAKDSATLFVNYVTAAALALGNGILLLSDSFNMPEVRTAIETNLTPQVATGVIAGIVMLNVAARFRTLGKD